MKIFNTKNLRISFLLGLVFVLFTACVKDRDISNSSGGGTTPTNPNDSTTQNDTVVVIHYWNFNASNLLKPTTTLTENPGSITTSDTYDNTDGTLINARNNADSGDCLRVRNPSTFMVINAPTVGYKSIKGSFAVMRTSNGAQVNKIEYSIDGSNYISTNLALAQITVLETWSLINLDFSAIEGATNNANFKIKITFSNGNTNSSGNDRYDNLVIEGIKE